MVIAGKQLMNSVLPLTHCWCHRPEFHVECSFWIENAETVYSVVYVKGEVGEVMTFTVVRVLARHRVLDISLGLQHTCVLVEPGRVYSLGCNTEAQLGCGSTRPQVAPISVKLFQQRHAVVSECVSCYCHPATVYTLHCLH